MKQRYLLLSLLLIAQCATLKAQHQTTEFDSTSVYMEDSGLSHVYIHKLTTLNDYTGCKNNSVQKLDYDPLSAYVKFNKVLVHRAAGGTDTIYDEQTGKQQSEVRDYIAPARMIYWGASQKMLNIGHLDPGDKIEIWSYRKGYTYALLADDDSKYIPPMRGHFYDIVPFWSNHPVKEKVYSVSIPSEKYVQYKVYNGEVKTILDSISDSNRIKYTFTKTNITPLAREPHSLANNDIQCKLLISTSPDWESKSRWFYNVNESYGSFNSTPELQKKVNELLKPAKNETDSISILTHWVADNMRYAGISMGEGEGYTLHNAQMNLTDMCGVCKDKAGLLVAMLRAAGFKSYAAMTMAGERIDRIPADQFNHSVAVVERRDGSYELLDPTWVPNVRELWSSAEQQQGYLIGLPEGADLAETPVSDPENHYIRINATSEIKRNGTLVCEISITAEGQSDNAVRGVFDCRMSEWQSNLEREILRIAPNAEIESVTHTDNDRYLEQPVTISYRFKVKDYALVTKEEIAFIPFSARNFYARAMSHINFTETLETRNYPFADRCSRLVTIEESIKLPHKYEQLHFPQINGVAGGAAAFGCKYWLSDNMLHFGESVVLQKRIYDAHEWPAFKQTVNNQNTLATTPVILTR